MLNFVVVLAACAGLVCGAITAEFTHDHVAAAAIGVVTTLLTLLGLAWLMIKVVSLSCDPPKEL